MNIFLKKLCISNQMYVNPSKDQCFPFLNPSSFFIFFLAQQNTLEMGLLSTP